ncbi:MAG: helix-turn-helix transcriptional regulator, partial [Clostridiales bacterium]|nr:helix-turn-helix transcriptional regulator [Clostridiales bacterium]
GITPTYLSRLMKQELGLSFNKYLTKTRINHAVKLMGQGLLLKDIALRVGYSSPYYFSTAFKKTLGSAPIEYRKSGGQP